jgi:hypothetical protein
VLESDEERTRFVVAATVTVLPNNAGQGACDALDILNSGVSKLFEHSRDTSEPSLAR